LIVFIKLFSCEKKGRIFDLKNLFFAIEN